MNSKKILFVDDEPPILNSLRMAFFDTDYEIYTAESGAKALALLAKEDIDLVVSDMRMPGMDGYQLLERIKETHPKVLRVILSGYADEKAVYDALLKNIAKIYLFKPWNNSMLLEMVEHLFKTEDMLSDNNILSLINTSGELPTLRHSLKRILDLTEGDADIAEICAAIERDQSIAAKLLHIANSAFYGLRTGSVRQAVKYLGLRTIRSLVLYTPIMDSFGFTGESSDYFNRQWNHAFHTNLILQYINDNYLGRELSDTATTAGLLHNIGVAFLLRQHKEQYLKLIQDSEHEGKDLHKYESEKFGIDHNTVGGCLLRWWDLPFSIMEAALYHHNPLDDRVINRKLVSAVHVAQKLAGDMLEFPHKSEFFPEAAEALGIDMDELTEEVRAL